MVKLFVKYIKHAWSFNIFIKNNLKKYNSENYNKEAICMVVQPWYGQPVPWVAIVLAIALKNNHNNVTILFNDINIYKSRRSAILFGLEKICIKRILDKISNQIRYVSLSEYIDIQEGSVNKSIVMSSIKSNSIHHSRGESDENKRQEFESYLTEKYNQMYLAAEAFFSQNKINKCITAGGVWGASGIIRHVANLNDAQVMCYDGGDGSILFSTVGASAQQQDIKIAFNSILLEDKDRNYAIRKGREKIERRIAGEDTDLSYVHGHVSNSYDDNGYYLILLNVVWDGAALDLHLVYESTIDWIIDTVKWVLDNTSRKIIVKQHPGERVRNVTSIDDYDKIIRNNFGENKRIVFIDSKSTITGYALIKSACSVIGFSSSSVVEAAALGKPTIITSNSYFSNFGFVYSAKTKDQYYTYLSLANDNKLKVELSMMDKACVCNYLTQTCNRLFTCFTTDNMAWLKTDISELIVVGFIVEAIETSTPVSLLVHRKLLKGGD